MYVVVRGDLPPGLRAAQVGHAVAEMCLRAPDASKSWHDDPNGNYLIVLEVDDQQALLDFYYRIKHWVDVREVFREPDLSFEATAFAAIPSPSVAHLFSHLILAYSHRRWWPRFRR